MYYDIMCIMLLCAYYTIVSVIVNTWIFCRLFDTLSILWYSSAPMKLNLNRAIYIDPTSLVHLRASAPHAHVCFLSAPGQAVGLR